MPVIRYSRAALRLEKAAKCASQTQNELLTARHLAKAERLILGYRFNANEVLTLIYLYDQVLAAATCLEGTIPIRQNCQEMQRMLRDSMA